MNNDTVTVPPPGGAVLWLAANACLLQSHLPPPQGNAPVVVQVVGVADSTDWPGWVLMLD